MDSPLRPKSVSRVEQSVDDYRWQKTAAASPQFARKEPKYDRAECDNCARIQMNDTEENGAEHFAIVPLLTITAAMERT